MKDETRAALSDQGTWLRLPVMLLFFLLLQVATPLLIVVSLVAWFMRLFTGQQPQGVIEFGQTIGKWFDRTADYLCGGAQRRPFPFEDHDCPSDRAADRQPSSRSSVGSSDQRGDAGTPVGTAESPTAAAGSQGAGAPEESITKKSTGGNASSNASSSKKRTRKKSPETKSSGKKSPEKRSTSKVPSRGAGTQKSGKKQSSKKQSAKKKSASKTGSKKASGRKTRPKDPGQVSAGSSGKSTDTASKDGDQSPSDSGD